MMSKISPMLALLITLGLSGPSFADEKFEETLLQAKKGDAQAQAEVGVMYAKGRGTRQDYVSAFIWMSAAKANGDSASAKNLQNLRKRMSLQEIVDGQAQAGRCIGSHYQHCKSSRPMY